MKSLDPTRWTLAATIFAMCFVCNAYAADLYEITKSGLDVGNPVTAAGGAVRTVSDSTDSDGGGTRAYDTSTGGTTASENHWSSVIPMPFPIVIGNNDFSSFCISKNGLLTFDTSVAGSLVAASLTQNNTVLPNPDLPDNTFCFFWEEFYELNSSDDFWTHTYGTAPNRQFWLRSDSVYWGSQTLDCDYNYSAVVFEETTNIVYIVEMRSEDSENQQLTTTVGFQESATNAVMATSGLNAAPGSPNISLFADDNDADDNEYYIFTPIPGARWNGSVSSDWNDPDNWDGAILPAADLAAVIPSAAGLANIPTLAADAETEGLTLESGAQLDLAGYTLSLTGDLENVGGIIIGNGGRIEFAGDGDQVIANGGIDIGNIHINNAGGTVRFGDDWTDVQTGVLTSAPGSRLVLDRLFNDFTNTTGTLEGDVHIQRARNIFIGGDPDVGTGAPGIILGHATIAVPDPLDIATILGVVGFKSLTLSGSGLIELGAPGGISQNPGFAGVINLPGIEMPELGDFVSTQSISLMIAGDVLNGTGHFQHTHGQPITVDGNLVVDSLTYAPTASNQNLVVNGTLVATGDVFVSGDGIVSVLSLFSTPGNLTIDEGTFSINQLNVPVPCNVGGDVSVSGSGSLSVGTGFGADLLAGTNFRFASNGSLLVGGLNAAETIELIGAGTTDIGTSGLSSADIVIEALTGITVLGGTSASGSVALRGSSTIDLDGGIITDSLNISGSPTINTGSVNLTGDFIDISGGLTNFGTLTLNGTGDAQTLFSDGPTGHFSRFDRIRILVGAGAVIDGRFELLEEGTNLGDEVIYLPPATGLELAENTHIRFSAGSTAFVQIEGSLLSAPSSNASRPLLEGLNAGFGMNFASGSSASITGLKLHQMSGIPTGTPTTAGVVFLDGSIVSAFNNVEIIDVANAVAAVFLGTDQIPGVFLAFDVFGTANAAIDANALSNDVLELRKGPIEISETRTDSLFGSELDNSNVLIWEDPNPLVIGGDVELPSAQVSVLYSEPLSANGGNRPYFWSLSNAPEWLSIDPDSGRLSGLPPLDQAGVVQFAVSVSDSTAPNLIESRSFTLSVDDLVTIPLQMTTTALTAGEEGETYGFALGASGGSAPYTWVLISDTISLPQGLELTEAGGLVGFLPLGTRGSYPFRIRVTDSRGQRLDRSFTMQVLGDQDNPIQAGVGGAGSQSSCSLGQGNKQGGLALVVAMLTLLFMAMRRRYAA